ncbi:MOP flippase family protein [Halioglobus maricola]|nr:MOP flippase family protein [Halioglobus maricola]
MATSVTTVVGFVQIAVLARILEPDVFGAFAFLTIMVALCEIFTRVGFSDVVIVEQDLSPDQLSTLYWINVFVGLLIYASLYFCAGLLSLAFDYPGISDLARLIGVTLVFGTFGIQFQALMRKSLAFRPLSILNICQALLGAIVAISLAYRGFGILSLVYSVLSVQALRMVVLLGFAKHYGWIPGLVFRPGGVQEQLKFGAFRVGAAIINGFNSRADQIAVGAILGPTALGYYNMAFSIAIKPFSKINPVLTAVATPIFSRIQSDPDAMKRGYRKGLRILMFINAPLLLGYIAVAPEFVDLVLGEGWEPVVRVSQFLVLYVLFRSANNLNLGLMLANGKYRWPLYWNSAILLVLPLSIALVALVTESLEAVAFVMVLGYLSFLVAGYFLTIRVLLGKCGVQYLGDLTLPIVVAALMCFGVVTLSSLVNEVAVLPRLISLVGFGMLLYFLLSLALQRDRCRELLHLIARN